jgi:flagellar basal-body rod protein FlgC
MSLAQVLEISSAGMDVQQQRLQVAASNIANSRTTGGAGVDAYRPLEVVVRSAAPSSAVAGAAAAAGALPRPYVAGIVESNLAPKRVYDPGHPDADQDGFISLPGVDPISSMMDLLDISRSYEANLRAFDVTRSLLQRTLDIGSKG